MSDFYFVRGNLNGNILVHLNYTYSKKREKEIFSQWRCRRGCPVYIHITNSLISFVSDISKHSHPNEESEIKILQFKHNLRISAALYSHIRPQKLYREELSKWTPSDRMLFPQYISMRSTLYEYRRKALPKLPKTLSQLHIEGSWCKTLDGEQFLLHEDGHANKILIFGTERSLALLCQCSLILMDGTFRSVPKCFKQLYTIHGEINGTIFPLLYCLLPNLQSITYERLILAIKSMAMQRNYRLTPETIQLDFEIAAIKAIRSVFPVSKIKGCFFHFSQAIWRKIQNLGLAGLYKTDAELKRWLRKCIILPLLPPEQLDDAWLILHSEAPLLPQITTLLNYIVETWMDEADARFNRNMWNHYYTTNNRTTNALESWHSRINSDVNRSHPNIWNFLAILKEDQQYNSTKLELAVREELITYRRVSTRTREAQYLRYKYELESGLIDLNIFMSKVSRFYAKAVGTFNDSTS